MNKESKAALCTLGCTLFICGVIAWLFFIGFNDYEKYHKPYNNYCNNIFTNDIVATTNAINVNTSKTYCRYVKDYSLCICNFNIKDNSYGEQGQYYSIKNEEIKWKIPYNDVKEILGLDK